MRKGLVAFLKTVKVVAESEGFHCSWLSHMKLGFIKQLVVTSLKMSGTH